MGKRKKIINVVGDSFVNASTALGVRQGLDAGNTYAVTNLSRDYQTLEAMYRGNWLAGMAVDCVAEDMTRAGIEVLGSIEPAMAGKLQKELTRGGYWRAVCDGIKWSRLYGGALIVLIIDGQDMATPLDIRTVTTGSLLGVRVLDKRVLTPSLNLVPFGVNAGLPESYAFLPSGTGSEGMGTNIHHTRVLRFTGVELPRWQAITEQWWGQSVLERVYDRLDAFNSVTANAAQLVHKAHLRTIQIEGLREVFAAGGQAELNMIKMLQQVNLQQRNAGITLLDSNDSFATTSYSFGGLSDLLVQFGQQISGALGIPLVRLFGQSPAGLSATGDSDIRMYYDYIRSQQESRLAQPLLRLLNVLYRSTFGTPPPEDFDIAFNPLWQTSQNERYQMAQLSTATVLQAFEAGIIDQATALKELQQASQQTGVFSNITPEQIAEAEAAPPDFETEEVGNAP